MTSGDEPTRKEPEGAASEASKGPATSQLAVARAYALRTVLVSLALLAGSVLVWRSVVLWLEPRVFELPLESRVTDLIPHLPEMAGPHEPAVVVIGSSAVLTFDPLLFDRKMAEAGKPTRSYNVALPGGNAEAVRLVAERLAGEFEHQHRKAGIVFLDLLPGFQAKSSVPIVEEHVQNIEAVLAPEDALWAKTTTDPGLAFRQLTDRYVFRGRLRSGARLVAAREINEEPSWWFGPKEPILEPWINTLEKRERESGDMFQFYRWDPATRGAPSYGADGYEEGYQAWLVRYRRDGWEWTFKTIETWYDFIELHFHEPLILDFMRSCRAAKRMSDHAMIVMPPFAPGVVEKRSPEAAKRLEDLKQRVRDTCGLPLVDLGEKPFVLEDFMDPAHLDEGTGRAKYTGHLVDLAKTML